MGDGRDVPMPDTAYNGIPHEQLKGWTDAGEPGDADGLAQSWQQMGNGLTEAAENLMIAVFGSEAGWTGAAANAMRARLQKVAEWSQKTGTSFNKASEAFVSQGESVGTAKTAMPDPVSYDPGQMIKDAASSGNPVRIALLPLDMYKQAQASREAHEQAAQVVAQRDAQLAAAAASIPPFEPPPSMNGEKQGEPPIGGPGMPGGAGVRPGPGAGGSGGRGASAGGGAGFPGGSFPGGGAGSGDGGSGDGGDDSGQTPPNINVPSLPIGAGTGTSGFSQGPPGGTGFGPGPGGGGFPGGPSAAGGGGGFNNAFGGGFGPGGAPRPGGGFGPMGPGAAAGAGNPAGAGGPAGMGGAGGRGAAGAGGRGGAGAGGMGAGRGQGGEDEEHQRPAYLVEPDPDATFGTDQLTAPPVIGG